MDGRGVLHSTGQYPETNTHLHPLLINPTTRKLRGKKKNFLRLTEGRAECPRVTDLDL